MENILDIISERKKEKDYVQFTIPFDKPLDIYIRVDDIFENRFVYFFGYTMGRDRVVIWGVYDSKNDKLVIESGCNDIKYQLLKLLKIWKQNGILHVGAEQRNLIDDRINFNLFYGNEKNFDNIQKSLLLIAWQRDLISTEDILKMTYFNPETRKNEKFSFDDLKDFDDYISEQSEREEKPRNEFLKYYEEKLVPLETFDASRNKSREQTIGKLMKPEESKKKRVFFSNKKQNPAEKYLPFEFKYMSLIVWEQYKLLKANVARYLKKAKKYPFKEELYESFLEDVQRFSNEHPDEYVKFLWDIIIKDYERNLNFVSIDQGVLNEITEEEYERLELIIQSMKQGFNKQYSRIEEFKKIQCPPDRDSCLYNGMVDSSRKECELYFYGNQIHYAEDMSDRRMMTEEEYNLL